MNERVDRLRHFESKFVSLCLASEIILEAIFLSMDDSSEVYLNNLKASYNEISEHLLRFFAEVNQLNKSSLLTITFQET